VGEELREAPTRFGARLRAPVAFLAILLAFFAFSAPPAAAQPASPAVKQGGQPAKIPVAYLRYRVAPDLPKTFLDPPPEDEGIAGARLGVEDNNTTGRFTGQEFVLEERVAASEAEIVPLFRELAAAGHRLVVADLPAAALLEVADLPEAREVTFFNVAARDDELRGAQCRANVLHLVPSRAMLTDALVQYLIAKRWRNILLVPGRSEADQAYAAAAKRSIQKFGARVVEEKPWTHDPGAQRTDTGHYQIAAEVARFTQGLSYDVLLVADEEGNFGADLPYRTTEPRPVVGTQGLVPTAWARPHEQWGATQLQRRFMKLAERWMGERDYAAWMALRAIGEGATRQRSVEPAAIVEFIRGESFELAAFKGSRLTFRDWNGQLRQPILLADANSLVSVSPQSGFLHQFSELDTLGFDRPETTCRMTRQ
jgi:ABC transporter substrate binding protein (PQQ-dependent alcohol dehydrogenase system)